MVSEIEVRLPATDGFQLGGVLYRATPATIPECAVIFNTGGGVAARRYRRFLRFLAESGISALGYDYRGIGQSHPKSLRGFKATLEDWSEYDCTGAIAWMRGQFPEAQLIGMAHSAGNAIMAGACNTQELAKFVMICPHTGYYGDYHRRYRVPMALVWHGVMPLVTRLWGYFPAQVLRLGDDIPKGVALQWAGRRSPLPHARLIGQPRLKALMERFTQVKGPALVLRLTDDAFATDAGVRRILSMLPGVEAEVWSVSPRDVGLARIEHFGFFRESARAMMWPALLARIVRGMPPRAAGAASAAFRDEGNEHAPAARISCREQL